MPVWPCAAVRNAAVAAVWSWIIWFAKALIWALPPRRAAKRLAWISKRLAIATLFTKSGAAGVGAICGKLGVEASVVVVEVSLAVVALWPQAALSNKRLAVARRVVRDMR